MKFSVIIPLYNKAPYIRKALESVFTQTYTDFELIIVDDGSTDDSTRIAEEYIREANKVIRLLGEKEEESLAIAPHCLRDSDIASLPVILIKQQNAGVSAARNNGVATSKGEYIAFLDADDWLEPTFLEKMAQFIADYPDAGLYASNYIYYKPGKTHVAINNIATGYFNYPKAYFEGDAMPIWTGATMISRKVYDETGGFPLGIKLGEDFLLWAKIAKQYNVAFLNEPLAWYNNDVPATLRATRNLHAPKHHMLFNLGLLGDEAIRLLEENSAAVTTVSTAYTSHSTPTNAEWQLLWDKLRVNGLLDYWLSNEYHNIAAEELKKVDWNSQPANIIKRYNTPIWILKTKRLIMRWGSIFKQKIIKIIQR